MYDAELVRITVLCENCVIRNSTRGVEMGLMQIVVKGEPIVLDLGEPIHVGALDRAHRILDERMPELFNRLPADHMWRKKLQHVVVTPELVHPIIASFRGELSNELFQLLVFIYRAHDIGRAIEALKKLGSLPGDYRQFEHHGEESVNLLQEWGVIDGTLSAGAWEVAQYAILHHFGAWTPTLPESPEYLDNVKYFVTVLLRDIDKLSTFKETTAQYLYLRWKKEREIAMHGIPERHAVIPASFLSTFERREVPDFHGVKRRNEERSYEGYMLYFLAWLFDVNLARVMAEIVESNAIRWLLQYFSEQLPETDFGRIKRTVREYLSGYGIAVDE